MKRFRNYLSEEVIPTAQVSDGSVDIERPAVRGQINATLTSVTAQPAVTPYVVLQRIAKALLYFHIVLPKRAYLEGDRGVEVIEVQQFGPRMGMTDQGEFVKEVPAKYFLFISYRVTNPVTVTYTAVDPALSSVGGMFKVTAKLVDELELQKLMATAEIALAEDAACRQNMAKMMAPKEGMHTALGDCDCTQGDSPSTKSAVSTMMRKKDKKLSADSLDEAMTRKQKNKAVLRFMGPDAGERILAMGKKEREEKKSFASAKKEIKRLKEEEQIDELKKSTYASYIKKAAKNQSDHSFDHGEDEHRQYGDRGEDPDRDKEVDNRERKISNREKGINRAADKLAKEEYEKVEAGVKKRPGETHTLHRRNPGHKTEYHTITTDRDGRKSVKTGSPKYIKKHWDKLEEEQIDELHGKGSLEKIRSHHQGEANKLSQGGRKQEKRMGALGRLHRDSEDREDAIKHHMGKAKKARGLMSKLAMREETLDEKQLTSAETRKKEEIVKSMKKKLPGFKERYGERAKEVMYATATKRAKQVAEAKKSPKDDTVLVTLKGDPHAKAGGGVKRIPKKEYNPKKHNMASE